MKRITLNIDESKAEAFLSFIKTLDYVSISDEIVIPEEQQREVERRLKDLEDGKMETRSWNEARKDIFKQ